MTHESDRYFVAGAIVGAIIATVAWLMIGAIILCSSNNHWEREAVKHSAAQYNSHSCEFEWVNEPREELK